MLHNLFLGILLGWGAAIPIGPINIEITRRNLQINTAAGTFFGLGGCTADLTFLVLLSLGAIVILVHPLALKIVSVIGCLILAWFGFNALLSSKDSSIEKIKKKKHYGIWQHSLQGYFLTLMNPYTILFWSSVSTQIATLANRELHGALYTGIGVIIGTVSWVLTLNTILHLTKHKLPSNAMRWLNIFGGIILLGFAAAGLIRAFLISH